MCSVLLNLSGVFLHGKGTDGSGVVMSGSDVVQASANLGLNKYSRLGTEKRGRECAH